MIKKLAAAVLICVYLFLGSGIAQANTLTVSTTSATNVTASAATLNGVFNNTAYGSVIVWFEYGTTNSLGTSTGQQTFPWPQNDGNFSFSLQNLNPNITYYFRAVARNANGTIYGTIFTFTTNQSGGGGSGSVPTVTTNSASNINQTSTTLNGTVNPNNSLTTAWFEWGTNSSLGNTNGTQSIGASSSNVNVSFDLSNLNSNTTYYFRTVASNNFGIAYGSILSFTTQPGQSNNNAPSVTTNSASNVAQTYATLNGTVNPNNSFTSVWFEWGSTASLGSVAGFQNIGNSGSNINFSASLSSLIPNVTYYFRAVAQNSFSTVYGSILSFTTNQNNQSGAPQAFTNSATNLTMNSAVLQGSISPNNANGTLTYGWFEWGTTFSLGNTTGFQSLGSSYYGNVDFSANLNNLQPNTIYYFRAVAQNSYGTSYGSILSFVTINYGYGSGSIAPSVVTADVSGITLNSAIMQSFVNPNGANAVAWFEWGRTQSLGFMTNRQFVSNQNNSNRVSETITNLLPGTLYYFRAVAQNNFGTSYGVISYFATLAINLPPPIPMPAPAPTPPAASDGPTLKISTAADNTAPIAGEKLIYTIVYDNISSNHNLRNLKATIYLPNSVEYVASDLVTASESQHQLKYDLDDLAPAEQNSFNINLKVSDTAKKGDQLDYDTVIEYTEIGSKKSTSVMLVLIVNGAKFLASVFDLFNNLSAFLLFIVIILAAIIIGLYRSIITKRNRSLVADQENQVPE